MSQTLCIAEFFVTVLRTEHERFAAAGVTVLTDGQVVYVAEAEKTGVAADLVDDIMSYDLMFALQKDKDRTVCQPYLILISIHINLDNKGQ